MSITTRLLLALILAVTLGGDSVASDREPPELAIDERFASLEDWRELTFPNVDRLTAYTIVAVDDAECVEAEFEASGPCEARRTVLLVESDDGGSGIVHVTPFDAYDFPIIEWRWRVEATIPGADPRMREGDMFPVRVYVNFEYDPGRATLGTRIQYRLIRALYGEYPPHGSLVYVWANRDEPATWYPNPYTARAMMYPAIRGSDEVLSWKTHRRNIIDDYRAAFGEDPPRNARLAVMGDAYGSGETSRAWIDYIRVGRE